MWALGVESKCRRKNGLWSSPLSHLPSLFILSYALSPWRPLQIYVGIQSAIWALRWVSSRFGGGSSAVVSSATSCSCSVSLGLCWGWSHDPVHFHSTPFLSAPLHVQRPLPVPAHICCERCSEVVLRLCAHLSRFVPCVCCTCFRPPVGCHRAHFLVCSCVPQLSLLLRLSEKKVFSRLTLPFLLMSMIH